MQEMESLNFGIDKYKEDFEALSQNMKEMENKFMVMVFLSINLYIYIYIYIY